MAYSYIPRTDVYRPSYRIPRPPISAHAHPENPLNYGNADVNRIPLNPHRRPTASPAQSPRLRDDHVDPFILRTTRAYDLVINYDRDSNGGQRWSREDIDHIHHVGRYLHGDVRNLKHWKEVVAKKSEQDTFTKGKIRDDTETLKKYCEWILDVIRDTERVPMHQRMTRDDGVQAGEDMDEGCEESEYGVDDDLNKLGGKAVEGEDKAEHIDPSIDARQADWATKSSTRFAW